MKKQKINWIELVLQLFVVFVGVTLGFLVNDWATKRNNENLETLHLTTLAKEINANYYVFEGKFEEDSIWLEKAKNIIELVEDDKIRPLDSLDIILELISDAEKSIIRINALQTLLNTGDINLIKNTKLKYDLNYYHSMSIGKVTMIESSLFDFSTSETVELKMKYYFEKKDKAFIKEALGILTVIYDYKQSLVPYYKSAKADSEYLLHAIDENSPHLDMKFIETNTTY